MHGVAVITGGSKGIGAATALRFAEQGYDLCLAYLTDTVGAASAVAGCERHGVRAVAVQADISSPEGVERLFAAADELGRVAVLVNNAAMLTAAHRVDETDFNELTRTFAVNVLSAFLTGREAIRRMSTRYGGAGGSIVNVSSVASKHGSPGERVDYAATKGALEAFTIGTAREVAAEGIRVNCVRPGFILTSVHLSVVGDAERMRRREEATPLHRGGDPREVAEAIAWLCSDEASFVVGSILDVAGGR